ncbi:DUF6701 domain-containing protein [Rheinheimera sp. FR7-31]|uniref:DUF6701 domain-containing protein n=1 Tax=Rheinheimera fenheensis TaxID=3152295 RepID=UPI00325F2A54
MLLRALLFALLLLTSYQAAAIACSDIWTQAERANSADPAVIPFPANTNPNLPEPMQPVDYYYNSSVTILNGAVRTSTGATTRFFVNGNLTLENNVQLNAGGPPQNLIIVVSGNVVINNNVEINGFILAGGAVQLYNNSVVNGAITARGALSNFGASVNYAANAVALLQGGVVCDQAVAPLPTARAHYPLDLCSAQNNSVIADLTGNYPATAINVGAVSDGRVLEAADFSAAGGDYISVPAAAINGLGNFSLALWFRLDNSTGFRELFSASNNTTDTELELYINAANEVRAGIKGAYYDFTGGSTSSVVANNSWTQVVLTRRADQLCLYINDRLVRCRTASNTSLNVVRVAVAAWWRANGSLSDDFRGDIDEVLLFSQALSAGQVGQIYQNQLAGNNFTGSSRISQCSQCLTDNFSTGSLSDSWVTARSSGTFTPAVIDGRLRLTQAVANQSTSATYQRLYPAANNLVVVEFDYYAWSSQGGTGADGVAVILSDATVTPQPGSFGGSLGYAQRNNGDAGFAGGWLGIALDEYGNFSNPTEGRLGGPGFRPQSVSIRGSAAGNYQYLTGTAANLNPRIDVRSTTTAAPGHRYRITVDSRVAGQALVSVQRNTGSGFSNLVAPFNALAFNGQAPVPENFFLSFTGSTGGSNNNHELDNLSICALRSLPVGEQIDHFEFDYSGQALTCKPETFTIRACKNPSCSELVTQQVTATLSPVNSANVNWLGGNVISFAGGSTTASLARTMVGSTTVGVSGSIPSTRPLSQTLCRSGGGALSAAACSVSFADSGLVFTVPDGIANRPDSNILLSAVRKDNASQQCVPAFANVSRNVAFWSSYITPDNNGRPVSWPVTVNSVEAGLSEADRQSQLLSFNAQGQANISVNYADAGLVQLNARYTGSAANNDAGLVMNGADQFIRRPAGLCIQTSGECAAADASCGPFRRAGDTFTLNISARAWQAGSSDLCANPPTPNFSQNNIGLSHQLLAPVTGASGSVITTSYNHNRQLQAQTSLTQSVSEVGVFRFSTNSFTYLGMTDPVPGANSGATGRFYPADFQLSNAAVTPACASFSYQGQPFGVAFNLTARNLQGQPTQNYTGAFASGTVLLQAEHNNNGQPLTARLSGTVSPSWLNGSLLYQTNSLQLNRASTPAPDGPFSQLALAAQVIDNDAVAIANADVNVASSGDCVAAGNCSARLLGLTDIRYGRLLLQNGAGPEEEPLPLVLRSEYWDGSRFLVNQQDSCSVLAAAQLASLSNPALSFAGGAAPLQQGVLPAGALWAQPSLVPGSWRIEYQASPWLQYNWSGTATGFNENPQAELMFGRFRGNPRQISWRELFQ